MAKSSDMPVIVGRVERLNGRIPAISRQLTKSFKQSGRWERQVLPEKVTVLHLRDRGGRPVVERP